MKTLKCYISLTRISQINPSNFNTLGNPLNPKLELRQLKWDTSIFLKTIL
jgi:hypothetical protein